MSTNESRSRHTSTDHQSNQSKKESHAMSTQSSVTPHAESAVLAVASAAAPTTTGTALPTAPPASPPAASLVTVALPPAGVTIPAPPSDYAPARPGEFRTVIPRKAELTCLPQALVDLSRFIAFDQTMGAVAPTQAEVTEALTAAKEWSATCQATDAWMGYARLMEGLAWRLVRAQLDCLRPAFALAVKRNPKIAEQYAGLAKLLTVPATAAQTAAATRKANEKAKAEGKPAIHGKVGKQRQRRAEKAALAAATTAPAQAPVAPAAR